MFYVDIKDGVITGKNRVGGTPLLPPNTMVISPEIYGGLTVPSTFTINSEGEIDKTDYVPVRPFPTEPSDLDYLLDLDVRLSMIELGI